MKYGTSINKATRSKLFLSLCGVHLFKIYIIFKEVICAFLAVNVKQYFYTNGHLCLKLKKINNQPNKTFKFKMKTAGGLAVSI